MPLVLMALQEDEKLQMEVKDGPTAEQRTAERGDVSINCGSTETSAALDGREWIGDEHTKISSSLKIKGSSTSSTINRHSMISADSVPYKTSRISRSRFSYAFQLNPGHKLIRFHFSPFSHRCFRGFKDFFTVEAGPFTLLSNFSASLTADALGVKSFAKEFCISIEENQPFNIIFSADKSIQSQDGTYAFINGIEIISTPMHLSFFHGGVQVVGLNSLVHIDNYNNTALEIIHRQNVKRSDDFVHTFGMGAAVPKQNPNKINNITWKISVDVGFRYLVRIHFCELGLKMAETGHVIFDILVNGIITNINIDLVKERNGNSILWHRDYMVMIQGRKQEGKRHLLISLQSTDEFIDRNVPLKGFEILKLNNPDNSLASPNPLPPVRDSPSQTFQNILGVFGKGNTIASAAITLAVVVNIVVYKLLQISENNFKEVKKPSARAQRLCRHFSLAQIQSATKNFNDAFVIGKGGFGIVYKGFIDNGQETVAIKRLKFSSNQGAHEFWTEIETLSELRHLNLVSLIGYCNEQQEMILVYEYMICGTLADHLYKLSKESNNSSLSWTQLLNICIGAGRGLDYLHTGHGIIHRDVKASNILLDENFVAKVSDFGLAKHEKRSKLQSHVSTIVKGTYGYFDPYYYRTGKLTRKSDTYAFGVVLLEVLCGRPAVDRSVDEEKGILTVWAREKIRKGELEQIISSNLKGEILPDSLKAFARVIESCLDDEPKKRPTMAQVVLQLELGVADVLPSTDETILLASTGNLTRASIDEQNVASLPKEQTNCIMENKEPPSEEGDVRRTAKQKQPRFWQWDAFWKRAKSSAKKDLEVSTSDVKVTKFDWVTILAATNTFSDSNRIGRGRTGTVYKAVLPTGQTVAVKQIHSCSVYGHNEFKNEISILSKLQHPNIMKLLGYCNDGEEMILVYEFMENKSLSDVLFDEVGRKSLPWTLRFKIIKGISRGVLHLQQDLGYRMLHRDLKPCNILMDSEMNPKIAFNFENKDYVTVSTTPVVFKKDEYTAPEFGQYGGISVASDMYSFGVIVLQIISGSRHRCLPPHNFKLSTHSWEMWNEEIALDLVDASIKRKFSRKEALRCIQIGLLCTQTQVEYRPAMPLVLSALEEVYDLPNEILDALRRRRLLMMDIVDGITYTS